MGLIIVEATNVDKINNTPWPHQLSLADDCYLGDFQILTESIHRHGAKVFVQLHSYPLVFMLRADLVEERQLFNLKPHGH